MEAVLDDCLVLIDQDKLWDEALLTIPSNTEGLKRLAENLGSLYALCFLGSHAVTPLSQSSQIILLCVIIVMRH